MIQSVGFYSGLFFFFFQAEDGIRDLVRSRGLGDVYKRQDANFVKAAPHKAASHRPTHEAIDDAELIAVTWRPVSYTHLTLPTIYSV